jgi:polyisoprenoid-binding protein YceI
MRGGWASSRPRLCFPLGLVLALAAAWPARAAALYHIDQRYGTIEFSVGVLGLFAVQGRFPRFAGDLLLDVERPEQSRIEVAIDTGAVEMPLQDQVELLRSEAYFDTARHPTARFASTAVQTLSPTHYRIHGTLRIRGVAQPQELDAVLTDRHLDQARQAEVADFVITGRVSRSAFGMVADRPMLSDRVRLDIRIRLTVGFAPDAG